MNNFAHIDRIAAKVDALIVAKAESPPISRHAATKIQEIFPPSIPAPSGNTRPSDSPSKAKGKTCDYGGGRFELSAQGVYFHGTDKDGNEQPPKWVCSPLAVIAKTRDNASGEWGRLLEWQDSDGVAHRWAMPLELLQGDGLEVRRELVRLGLHIGASKAARDLLATYLQVWPIEQRARCVERLGWHGGVYVTPSEAVGETDEITVFQNSNAIEPALFTAGTLEGWRETVGSMAAGNSRLMFALCVAFAAPLADVVGEDSGGFHLRGASSSGKSTALKLAASIWGNPAKYPRLWRATANGLEGLAALHNDGLLILDELSQIDPREAGEAAYLLANGQGKTRAGKTGAARKSASWRLLFLSAGEETLAAMMGKAGKSANAGQEIRLADIEADAGAGMGAFENIHQSETPAAFALALKDAASAHHGAAGMEWLRCIVQDRADIAGMASGALAQFVQTVCPPQVSGQVQRVARRFALVAFAGELASHYGITGWQQGQATAAAKTCFTAWLEGFGGGGNKEGRALLEQVRAFIELHGASRFEELGATHAQRVPNRAGFMRTNEAGQREYLVLPEVFKRELCKGFALSAACKELQGAGWLLTKEATRYTQKPRLPEIGATRVYVLGAGVLEGE